MKRLIVGAALVALAGGAGADWTMEKDGAVLRSEGAPFEVFMPAPGVRTIPFFSKSLVRIKDADSCFQKQHPLVMGANSDAYPSIFINDKKVRARAVCKGNDLLVAMDSQPGQKVLNDAIRSNADIKMQLQGVGEYVFANRSRGDVAQEIARMGKGI